MKRKYTIGLVVLVLIILVAFKLSSNKREIDAKSKPAPQAAISIPVKVAVATEQNIALSILKTGNLAPFKEAKVLTTVSGLVQQVQFALGDRVKTGQVLAQVDTRANAIDLQKATSNAAKLKNDLQTYTELYEGKAATREKLEEASQHYKDAQAEVAQIQRQIADGAVRAPIDGIVSSKVIEEGVYANAGTELATIVNLSQAKVQVNLTESEVYQIQEGQAVKITADVYPGVAFEGSVTFISPQADETHNYPVEIIIKSAAKHILRSGTFVYADFSATTSQQMIVIPREALVENMEDAAVYVVDANSRAVLRKVTTGRELDGTIEIRSGVQKGETVITSGQINLKNGTAVSISK
jgi:membrane fusion protein, multidrug efflux system